MRQIAYERPKLDLLKKLRTLIVIVGLYVWQEWVENMIIKNLELQFIIVLTINGLGKKYFV